MSIAKYINKNKIGGIILIIVIIIAFGFGGFGGGFMSNNQNNVAKINKTNVTTQDFINYVNQSGISQQAIRENLENNIIEELLSNLVSSKLLDLEINDFEIMLSKKALLNKIKSNENFLDSSGIFRRIKYEKFLLENNISAPIFEKRLKSRELQKKLFDFIGAGTVSPKFLVRKIFENENKKLELDFIDLEKFYKKHNDFSDDEIIKFIDENSDKLKIEFIDFKYSLINPLNLTGVDEFNQSFFDKLDEIESNILNGKSFNEIILQFELKNIEVKNYKLSDNSSEIEKKIYDLRKNKYDIFEFKDNFIIYEINNLNQRKPNINDKQIKKEILELLVQKDKYDYNKKILEEISNNKFDNNKFLELGKNEIQSITLNSIKDNKKFEINSVEMLYSLPINTFTLINDENDKIYLTKIKNYKNILVDLESDQFKSFILKENTYNRKTILKSYDVFLNNKYNVDINQTAINNIKNLF